MIATNQIPAVGRYFKPRVFIVLPFALAFTVIHKCEEARHSGRDCRNPDYMDVFKLAIHGTGYPLPSGYDELPSYLCITM